MINRKWPTEDCERLKSLWAQGLTMAEIATMFGVTKNVIAGKLYRMKLQPRRMMR